MILGTALILIGTSGLFINAVKPDFYEGVIDKISNKRNKSEEDKEMSLDDRCKIYSKLFKGMGIMKNKDWIKVTSYEDKPCYYLTKFKLSDSLFLSSFVSKLEDIRNKLGVKHLEIYADKYDMCFRVRKLNMPMENYTYTKTPHHLVKLGLDLDSNFVYWNLKSDPHIGLYANTGAGKSSLTHTPICHIIQNDSRATFYFIDLKNGVEYGRYKNLPQCKGFAKDIESAKKIISEIEEEAEKRYKIMEEAGYSDYYEYIKDKPRTKMTHCFIFIDEFATLMFDKKKSKDNEEYSAVDVLVELATKIRFVGMHLFAGTQRCTKSYIDPDLKNNLTCTIGMRVMNKHNSMLILDEGGLEELDKAQGIVRGDGKQVFFRSCFINKEIIDNVLKPYETEPTTKVEVSETIKETRYEPNTQVIDIENYQETKYESPFK